MSPIEVAKSFDWVSGAIGSVIGLFAGVVGTWFSQVFSKVLDARKAHGERIQARVFDPISKFLTEFYIPVLGFEIDFLDILDH